MVIISLTIMKQMTIMIVEHVILLMDNIYMMVTPTSTAKVFFLISHFLIFSNQSVNCKHIIQKVCLYECKLCSNSTNCT